jgi:hypothetical protein
MGCLVVNLGVFHPSAKVKLLRNRSLRAPGFDGVKQNHYFRTRSELLR